MNSLVIATTKIRDTCPLEEFTRTRSRRKQSEGTSKRQRRRRTARKSKVPLLSTNFRSRLSKRYATLALSLLVSSRLTTECSDARHVGTDLLLRRSSLAILPLEHLETLPRTPQVWTEGDQEVLEAGEGSCRTRVALVDEYPRTRVGETLVRKDLFRKFSRLLGLLRYSLVFALRLAVTCRAVLSERRW